MESASVIFHLIVQLSHGSLIRFINGYRATGLERSQARRIYKRQLTRLIIHVSLLATFYAEL